MWEVWNEEVYRALKSSLYTCFVFGGSSELWNILFSASQWFLDIENWKLINTTVNTTIYA